MGILHPTATASSLMALHNSVVARSKHNHAGPSCVVDCLSMVFEKVVALVGPFLYSSLGRCNMDMYVQ